MLLPQLPTELLNQIISDLDPESKFETTHVSSKLREIAGHYLQWNHYFKLSVQAKLAKAHAKQQELFGETKLKTSKKLPPYSWPPKLYFTDLSTIAAEHFQEHPVFASRYQQFYRRLPIDVGHHNYRRYKRLITEAKGSFTFGLFLLNELGDSNSIVSEIFSSSTPVIIEADIKKISKFNFRMATYILNIPHVLNIFSHDSYFIRWILGLLEDFPHSKLLPVILQSECLMEIIEDRHWNHFFYFLRRITSSKEGVKHVLENRLIWDVIERIVKKHPEETRQAQGAIRHIVDFSESTTVSDVLNTPYVLNILSQDTFFIPLPHDSSFIGWILGLLEDFPRSKLLPVILQSECLMEIIEDRHWNHFFYFLRNIAASKEAVKHVLKNRLLWDVMEKIVKKHPEETRSAKSVIKHIANFSEKTAKYFLQHEFFLATIENMFSPKYAVRIILDVACLYKTNKRDALQNSHLLDFFEKPGNVKYVDSKKFQKALQKRQNDRKNGQRDTISRFSTKFLR